MSRENIELTRRAYDAYNRGDLERIVTDFAPEFEYVTTGVIPDTPAVYRGPDAWMRFSAWLRDELDDVRVEVHGLTDAGDRVLAHVTLHGRGRQSGLETAWELWHVWSLRDRKVIRGQAFARHEDALTAAGLRD